MTTFTATVNPFITQLNIPSINPTAMPSIQWTTHEEALEQNTTLAQTLDEFVTNSKTERKQEKPLNTKQLLQELYPYKPLKLKKTECSSFEKIYKLKSEPFNWCTTQGLIGIEIEVENIKATVPIQAYWEKKQDGSLRNHGLELVSIPLHVKQIQLAVEHVFDALNKNNLPDFSNRTSIHIHVNCRDMTQEQVYVFCLLYTIFEKHFFKVVGTKRMSSIFCVPLFRTNYINKIEKCITNFSPDWQKYCALNLLPLMDNSITGCFGTIEFRHLHGTQDQQQILHWINDILCLRNFALKINKQELLELIQQMNTTSSYLYLYNQVFDKGRKILKFKSDFEECISNIKRELFGDTYTNTLKKSDASVYWTTANNLGLRG